MKNSRWKIGQAELEDPELNDGNGNCGHVSREVKSCADPAGAASG